MSFESRVWTTPERAAAAADRMRDEVEMELRDHARLLIKVADAIAAEDGLLDKPEPWGQHDPNPFVPLMLFLAMRRTRQAVADVRGNPRGSDPLLEEARDLRRAREAFKTTAKTVTNAWDNGALAVDSVADKIMRATVGAHAGGTVRVGDVVTWSDAGGGHSGEVVAIADGMCVLTRLSHLHSSGSSSRRGFEMVPVTEVKGKDYDFY